MYNPRCCVCGKFVSYNADYGVPFGGSQDYEPPDPEFYCVSCIEEEKEYYREIGYVPTKWVPADWHYELAKELGFALAGPTLAGWSHFRKKDQPLPDGWVWRNWEEENDNK